jgi:DDE superfamily endonuclease
LRALLNYFIQRRDFGRPPKLSRADQLLLSLIYWREYRTEFHIGLTYGVSEPTICRTVKSKQILATAFCNGSEHDFQLFKCSHCNLSPQTCVLADAGYQGLAGLHPNSQTPAKKSKLHPLSREQKTSNRALSGKRILIENIIRILSERYRNRGKRFGLHFNLVAAICNLELKTVH